MKTARIAAIVTCLTLAAVGWSGPLAAAEPGGAVIAAKAPVTAERAGLWGTREIRSGDLTAFKKWTGVMARFRKQRRLETEPCTGGACPLQHWRNFLASIEGRDARYQINAVHRYANAVRYIPDRRNHGIADRWSTPAEFLGRGGDCEDYAITKYLSLKALGFDANAMRIVVLKDMSLGIAHAVLVVEHQGERLLLDNQLRIVVATDKIRHYRARYSINESHWWLHRTTTATPTRLAAAAPMAKATR